MPEAAAFVAARLASKGLSPHRLAASLRGSSRSELPYSGLRAVLAERGLAFEAGSQPWERLLRELDPTDSGVVEIERLIRLVLEGEQSTATPAALDPHPYPNLQSQLRGGACTCASPVAEGPAGASRRSVLSRLAAGIATTPDAHHRLLRELRRADGAATGQCGHGALMECFSHAGRQLQPGEQPLLVLSAEDALALCAQSPSRTTVAYQQLLEDLEAAVRAQTSSPTRVGTTDATRVDTHRHSQAVPASQVSECVGRGGDVVVSDLTGIRVRRPSEASRALAFEGAAGRRATAFAMQ